MDSHPLIRINYHISYKLAEADKDSLYTINYLSR